MEGYHYYPQHYEGGGESSQHQGGQGGDGGDGGDDRHNKKGKIKGTFDAYREKFRLNKEERMEEANKQIEA